MMSNPNLGPELSDPSDPDSTESNRRSNPASAHLEETPSRVIKAAQARATTVSHRFGGARYALTRPGADVAGRTGEQVDPAQSETAQSETPQAEGPQAEGPQAEGPQAEGPSGDQGAAEPAEPSAAVPPAADDDRGDVR